MKEQDKSPNSAGQLLDQFCGGRTQEHIDKTMQEHKVIAGFITTTLAAGVIWFLSAGYYDYGIYLSVIGVAVGKFSINKIADNKESYQSWLNQLNKTQN